MSNGLAVCSAIRSLLQIPCCLLCASLCLMPQGDLLAQEATVETELVESEAQDESVGESNAESAVESSAEPQELPEGYQEELDRRIKLFRQLRLELEDAITKQREIYIKYANREQYGPKFRRAYSDERNRSRIMMSKVYDAALDILRIGYDEEAITYMVTMLQHRHSIGFYDRQTLEGAARLIDGGSNLQYMFEVAARSAVVCGQFDMAKQLYEAVPDEDQKEIDLRLEYSLEDLRKEYEAEEKLRAAEFESDQLPRVKFKTTQGDFVAELFIDQAPTAVSRFIQLVEEGFYDGKDFFQVIEHLLALAGDPDFTPGDPSVKFLVDEHTRPDARSGLRGALVMAKVPREDESDERFYPNSASSQFAILLTPIVDAQRDQTIFGSVIEGMETVCRLNRVDPHEKKKKGEEEVPADSIIEATMIRRPDTLPAPEFYQ
jgi:cyclophilin family peptidyl-prolyl cis-trans isomerase